MSPVFPGAQFTIPTTTRVYDQGPTSESCCAHAVAAAVETSLVSLNGMDPSIEAVAPFDIYNQAKHIRSVSRALAVARKGVTTPLGVEHAEADMLGQIAPMDIRALLQRDEPVVSEIHVASDFKGYHGPLIYRPVGALELHALCIVGYGVYPATFEEYWIAKNSYGPGWGVGGYALLLKGDPDVRPEESVSTIRRVFL